MSVIQKSLQDCLSRVVVSKHIHIAFSGGIDSTVLLHAAHTICLTSGHTLNAIHIDHQIHKDSHLWAQHSEKLCKQLNIPIKKIKVNVEPFSDAGPEGAARIARYQAFTKLLSKNDVLLTAHHADDQIETVLLQLFRGTGVHGLSGCAVKKNIGDAELIRPLLKISRKEIEGYASKHQLKWLDDPSNESTKHDRNYLRHQVMPLLHTRWKGLRDTIGRSSQWQRESAEMLDQLAQQDLSGQICHRLSINAVSELSDTRLKNALRWWIRSNGFSVPSAEVMNHLIKDLLKSREDSESYLQWQGCEVRKYRGELYIQNILPKHDATVSYEWNLNQTLDIPNLNIRLTKEGLRQFGVTLENVANIHVRFRLGGEVIRPRGRGCSKDLKTLFQEEGVEPWLRDRIPLLFHREKLIFVWGYWISEGY